MRIYVIIGVFQGVINEINGFLDPGEAQLDYDRLQKEYGIEPGEEAESENSVQLHEVYVEARPASVVAMRQIW